MIWIKHFIKDSNDFDAKFVAKLYHEFLKDGPKKDALGYHYNTVIKNGNKAEKIIADLLDKELAGTLFSCVSNIRIEGQYSKEDNYPSEFDFILEDKLQVIYINVKYTDFRDTQEDQVLRHGRILSRLIPNGKTLSSLSVLTTNEDSVIQFTNSLKELTGRFTGEDDILCHILSDIHRPITHERQILEQFKIVQDDFLDYSGFCDYIKKPKASQNYELIEIHSKILNIENRTNTSAVTDILFIDDPSNPRIHIPIGEAKHEFIGKMVRGRFRKNRGAGTMKMPPFIAKDSSDSYFDIE